MGAVKVLGVNMFTDIEEFKCRALYFFIHFELRLDGVVWFVLFFNFGCFLGGGVFGNFFSTIVLLFFIIIFLFFALISPLSGFIV